MNDINDPAYQHLRSKNSTTGQMMTWKETLEEMCKYYGTFCGRWHSNEFWKKTLGETSSMTEIACLEKIVQIESEANGDLAYWRTMQS